MEKKELLQADRALKRKREARKWKRLAGVLGCLVVAATVYALMRPASTLERDLICGMEEHQHSVAQGCYVYPHHHGGGCYADGILFSCGNEDAEHVHTVECLSAEAVLQCTSEDAEHVHAVECYAAEPILSCPLTEGVDLDETVTETDVTLLQLVCELPEHTHDENTCYAAEATERGEVTAVAELLDALPTAEAVQEKLDAFTLAEDFTGSDTYLSDLWAQLSAAQAAFDALTEEQQQQLNAEKLTALTAFYVVTEEQPEEGDTFELRATTESGIEIVVSGDNSSLPCPAEEVTLKVAEIQDADAAALQEQALAEEDLTAQLNYLFDITLWRGEEEIQPVGTVNVQFIGVGDEETTGAKVYHIDAEAGEITDMNAIATAEAVTLETEHFSTYAVATVANASNGTVLAIDGNSGNATGGYRVTNYSGHSYLTLRIVGRATAYVGNVSANTMTSTDANMFRFRLDGRNAAGSTALTEYSGQQVASLGNAYAATYLNALSDFSSSVGTADDSGSGRAFAFKEIKIPWDPNSSSNHQFTIWEEAVDSSLFSYDAGRYIVRVDTDREKEGYKLLKFWVRRYETQSASYNDEYSCSTTTGYYDTGTNTLTLMLESGTKYHNSGVSFGNIANQQVYKLSAKMYKGSTSNDDRITGQVKFQLERKDSNGTYSTVSVVETGGTGSYMYVTNANATGATTEIVAKNSSCSNFRVFGLPAGTYKLYETQSPAGFDRAARFAMDTGVELYFGVAGKSNAYGAKSGAELVNGNIPQFSCSFADHTNENSRELALNVLHTRVVSQYRLILSSCGYTGEKNQYTAEGKPDFNAISQHRVQGAQFKLYKKEGDNWLPVYATPGVKSTEYDENATSTSGFTDSYTYKGTSAQEGAVDIFETQYLDRHYTLLLEARLEVLNLPEGVYKIEEVGAPSNKIKGTYMRYPSWVDGYIFEFSPTKVEEYRANPWNPPNAYLTYGSSSAQFWIGHATKMYDLTIPKVDSSTNAGLAGAEFTLSQLNSGRNAPVHVKQNNDGTYTVCSSSATGATTKLTTPATGNLVIKNISDGTYYLTETKAPTDYLLPAGAGATTTFTLPGATGTIVEDVEQKALTAIPNTLYDADNATPTTVTVSGVKLEAYDGGTSAAGIYSNTYVFEMTPVNDEAKALLGTDESGNQKTLTTSIRPRAGGGTHPSGGLPFTFPTLSFSAQNATYTFEITEKSQSTDTITCDNTVYTLTVETGESKYNTTTGSATLLLDTVEVTVPGSGNSASTVYESSADGITSALAVDLYSSMSTATFTNTRTAEGGTNLRTLYINTCEYDSEKLHGVGALITDSRSRYKLQRYVSNTWVDVVVQKSNASTYLYQKDATASDGDDVKLMITGSGTTMIHGLPAGKYKLIQAVKPQGYYASTGWAAGQEIDLTTLGTDGTTQAIKSDNVTIGSLRWGAPIVTVSVINQKVPAVVYLADQDVLNNKQVASSGSKYKLMQVGSNDAAWPVELTTQTGTDGKTEYVYSKNVSSTSLDAATTIELTGSVKLRLPCGKYQLYKVGTPEGYQDDPFWTSSTGGGWGYKFAVYVDGDYEASELTGGWAYPTSAEDILDGTTVKGARSHSGSTWNPTTGALTQGEVLNIRVDHHPVTYTLPETGGAGVWPTVAVGAALVTAASVGLVSVRRRRQRA